MTFKQQIISACAILLTVSCATTSETSLTHKAQESCQDTHNKLLTMKDSSPQKSTLLAYYNKRCG